MVLSGRLETLEYGAYSLDATVRNGASSSVVTLWQRGLAFDNGWRANNGFGMLNTPAIDLSRQQYRFYVPTFPIAGLETEWIRNGNLQLQASVGSPGIYNGVRLAGFSRLGGRHLHGRRAVGPPPGMQAGFQMADAHGVETGSVRRGEPSNTNGALVVRRGSRGRTADERMQMNLLDSQANEGRHNLGAWFDGETRTGRYRHNYGVFRFEPNMLWGYTPINSDLLGGYYRVNYQSQQWIWAAGVDSVSSVTGNGRERPCSAPATRATRSTRRSASEAGRPCATRGATRPRPTPSSTRRASSAPRACRSISSPRRARSAASS